jgi:Zn-dependent protease with chaperone function
MTGLSSTSQAEILAAFEGPIRPVRVSMLYRLGLLLVAVAMVVLPLLYIGVIGVVVYLLKLHIESAGAWLSSVSGQLWLLAFVAPIMIGGIGILFMIKPLFARQPAVAKPIDLDPCDESALFDFVREICGIVGAPVPSEIHVDCAVNASAALRRGFRSFLGGDLVLTIGLPLAAGLNLRQFAAVLAHEFGHFSQGTAMRLTYVIRVVNRWFARVVYERDAWDVKLEQWSHKTDIRIATLLLLSRVFVWLTRRILWVLMMAGHIISCLMMRQMEYDADRYEARVSGSDCFASTTLRFQQLNLAARKAFQLIGQSFNEGQLAEDLPRLIEHQADQIPTEVLTKIHEHVRLNRTGALDTHPADGDRIESARREAAAGVFRLERPATVVFGDFDRLSRRVTMEYYRQVLQDRAEHVSIVSNATLLEGSARIEVTRESLERFFLVPVLALRSLGMPAVIEPVNTWKSAYDGLTRSRKLMIGSQQESREAVDRLGTAEQHRRQANLAKAMLCSRLKINVEEFNLTQPTADAAEALLSTAEEEMLQPQERVEEYVKAARCRLVSSLQLMRHPSVVERVENVDRLAAETAVQLTALASLEVVFDAFQALRDSVIEQSRLFEHLEDWETNAALRGRILGLTVEMRGHLLTFRKSLTHAYPFDHGQGSLTIHAYLLPDEIVDPEMVVPHCEQMRNLVERFDELYVRLCGTLTLAAEKIEGALGLKPIAVEAERVRRK